jgi:hypothetical protein
MKYVKTFESFTDNSGTLAWTVDGYCGAYAATYKALHPESQLWGILDKTYKPSPTIQHYFIEDDGKFFDGAGKKSLKDFEKKYRGMAVKIEDSGFEKGKSEDDYTDLPEWGVDKTIEKALKNEIRKDI